MGGLPLLPASCFSLSEQAQHVFEISGIQSFHPLFHGFKWKQIAEQGDHRSHPLSPVLDARCRKRNPSHDEVRGTELGKRAWPGHRNAQVLVRMPLGCCSTATRSTRSLQPRNTLKQRARVSRHRKCTPSIHKPEED